MITNLSTPAILNALYEVIYQQEYISWKLPSNTHILLSANPDDGSYTVGTIDEAATSRMVTFDIKFSINDWVAWATRNNIDGRAQNFLISNHHELMDRSKTKEAKINARSYTMFANIIGGLKDWSSTQSLALILQIASGCFDDPDNVVGGLFTQFIANKLDKLISPEELVTGKWETVRKTLEDQLYDGDNYRADIASVVTTRFVNYSLHHFEKGGDSKTVINRILDLVDNDKILLTEDLLFSCIKTLNKQYPTRANALLLNPKIAKKLI